MSVVCLALANFLTAGPAQCREQGCGAAPEIVMRHPFGLPHAGRDGRISALNSLALAFLVDAVEVDPVPRACR
jgi:hypothetical protein